MKISSNYYQQNIILKRALPGIAGQSPQSQQFLRICGAARIFFYSIGYSSAALMAAMVCFADHRNQRLRLDRTKFHLDRPGSRHAAESRDAGKTTCQPAQLAGISR